VKYVYFEEVLNFIYNATTVEVSITVTEIECRAFGN